jgi:hypothetical protein
MATYESEATGNYNADATWAGSGTPGVTDTTNINNGHVVTITAGFTQTAGVITVKAGGDLRLTGGQTVTLESGATLVLTNNGVTCGRLSHTGTGVAFVIPNAASSYISATGISNANRCEIWGSSNANSIRIEYGAAFYRCGLVRFQYAHLKYLGTSGTAYAVHAVPTGADTCFIKDSLVEYCGEVFLDESGGIGATADLQFLRNTHQNSQGTYTYRFGAANALTTGTRLFQRNVCDKQVWWLDAQDWTVGEASEGDGNGNYFHESVLGSESSSSLFTAFDGNLIRLTAADSATIGGGGPIRRNYFLLDYDLNNPHAVNASNYVAQTIADNVFESTGSSYANGDMIACLTGSATRLITITGNLMLPRRGDSRGPGCLVVVVGTAASGLTVAINHNTATGYNESSTTGAFNVQETNAGTAGMVTSCRSNLAWSNGAVAGMVAVNMKGGGSATTDYVTSANLDYNGKWSLGTGSNGVGYDQFVFSSGSPGAHDVVLSADPFVDKDRDIAAWAVTQGSAGGTEAARTTDALNYLRARNESTWNGTSTILALWTWVRNGFKVTAASLNNAGHDGATIGAMGYEAQTAYTLTAASGSVAWTGTAAALFGAVPQYYGEAHNPPDSGSISGPGPQAVTPPAGMRAGDLALIYAMYRNEDVTLSISEAGGQTWTAETKTTAANNQTRLFWATFNGTWSANPSVLASGATQPLTVWLEVFRASSTSKHWELDLGQQIASGSISASPSNLTISSPGSTNTDNAVVVASWGTTFSRTLALQTGTYANPNGVSQVRNLAGNDTTLGLAYRVQAVAGTVGDITVQQTGPTAGNYATTVVAFREVTSGAFSLSADPGSYVATGTAAALTATTGSETITAEPGAFTVTGSAVTLGLTVYGDIGGYTVTGTAATLTRDAVIPAASGSITWTGTAATLPYLPPAPALMAEPTSYAITGLGATLLYSGYSPAQLVRPRIATSISMSL